MSRRIDIELTSRANEGTFTWRAAGAKQPRGSLDGSLLPEGTTVGDIVRAELESGLDGFEIVAVLAPAEKAAEHPANRIEVLGAPQRGPDVVVSYAPGARRRRDEGPDARRGAGRRESPPRRSGPGSRPGPRTVSEATSDDGSDAAKRPPDHEARRGTRRPERSTRPDDARARTSRPQRSDRPVRREEGERATGIAPRKDRRPSVSTVHRNALLATLGPQELPIAEQLLRGGIPAVRAAIAEGASREPDNVAARENRATVLAIAEQLLPRVNLASWKDRASSAHTSGKELRLRELRAVVSGSRTVTLDDEGRALAKTLRESLDQRVDALREEWAARVGKSLDDGRVLDALHLATRPPEPATRVPAELAVRLADAAGAAMDGELSPSTWRALLDAVVASPVRRTVKPRGIPHDPEARDAALRAAGSVPVLAKLLGLRIPPPPPRRPMAGGPRLIADGAGRSGAR